MSRVRVSVLSDDRLFCDGLMRIIAAEASFIVSDECPQVLLIDSRSSGALGLCATLLRDGGARVIFVAAPEDDHFASDALAAGARGILPKSAHAEELVRAVRVVSEGLIWAPRRVIVARLDHLTGTARRAGEALLEERLSIREREVFRHAATGLGNKELADRLDISEATVKVHLTHIFQKLGLRGRAELAAAYHGISRAQ